MNVSGHVAGLGRFFVEGWFEDFGFRPRFGGFLVVGSFVGVDSVVAGAFSIRLPSLESSGGRFRFWPVSFDTLFVVTPVMVTFHFS